MTSEQIEIQRLRAELRETTARAETAERELERTRIDVAARRDQIAMLRGQLSLEISNHFETHVALTNANDRVLHLIAHEGEAAAAESVLALAKAWLTAERACPCNQNGQCACAARDRLDELYDAVEAIA